MIHDEEVAVALLLCNRPEASSSILPPHASSSRGASASTLTPPSLPQRRTDGDTFPATAKLATRANSGEKRGKFAEDDSLAEEGEAELNEDGSKPLKNTRRAAQNRAAQRAFRERKDQYLKDLERKSKMLDDVLIRERQQLRDLGMQQTMLDDGAARERGLEKKVVELEHLIANLKSLSFVNGPSDARSPFPAHAPAQQSAQQSVQQSAHFDPISRSAWEQREGEFLAERKQWEMERLNNREERDVSHRAFATEREEHARGMREREGLKGMLEESRRDYAIMRGEVAQALQAVHRR